jgi:SAM-dependent methyltransferase
MLPVVNFLLKALPTVKPARLRFARAYCPVCERKRLLVKLDDNEIAVRCCACRASVVTMSIAAVISQTIDQPERCDVYELSARGPLLRFLRHKYGQVTCSEYFPDIPGGSMHDGVMCQDVQKLTFADNSFDLCTSTDVLEHVQDDHAGFADVCRVLRPGGHFIFTVPLSEGPTLERAVLDTDGSVKYLLPPEYHGDPIGKSGQILAFRTYGPDICTRLLSAGFTSADIVTPPDATYWGISRKVIVARK